MAKNYGINDIEKWEFDTLPLSQKWLDHLGDINQGFRILIEGDPKSGKTEYVFQFMKELALNVGKVNLNSTEQGKSKSLKSAFTRNKMNEIPAGQFMVADASQKNFETWYRCASKPNSGKTLVLDSADYMKLTFDQWKMVHEKFKNKNLILVCWLINPNLKAFKHTMDIVVRVKDFKADPISRFGGHKPMIIWNKKPEVGSQLSAAL